MDFHTFALLFLIAFSSGFVSGSLMVYFDFPKSPEENKDMKALSKSIEDTKQNNDHEMLF